MNQHLHRVRRIIVRLVCIATMMTLFPSAAFGAGALSMVSIGMSTNKTGATATYTLGFTTTTTAELKQISFRFSTVQDGTSKPVHLDLSGSSLGTVTGVDSNWSLNATSHTTGLLSLTRTDVTQVESGTAISVGITTVVNSAIDDCETENNGLHDTCQVKITSYSDDGSSEVDIGYGTYTVVEDPQCTFSVGSVASGTTTNGITSTSASTDTAVSFGIVPTGSPRFVTHALTITTNAPGGYTVYANLREPIVGVNGNSAIDPFGAVNATWTTPQSWATPDGTEGGSNTGWLGLNTTDKNTTGWDGNTSGKFGPLGSIARIVATSTGPARSGTTIYVTYALGVNGVQPGDSYGGLITYDVRTIY